MFTRDPKRNALIAFLCLGGALVFSVVISVAVNLGAAKADKMAEEVEKLRAEVSELKVAQIMGCGPKARPQ